MNKYGQISSGSWDQSENIPQIIRRQYKHIMNTHKNDNLVIEISKLYKNLQLRRKIYPLKKRQFILYKSETLKSGSTLKKEFENYPSETLILGYNRYLKDICNKEDNEEGNENSGSSFFAIKGFESTFIAMAPYLFKVEWKAKPKRKIKDKEIKDPILFRNNSIIKYLLSLKDILCLSKEDLNNLYDFPFELGEQFDYL